LRDTSSLIAVSSGVVGVLGASEVNPSRNVAGTIRERGNLPGTVSPEAPITASPACANSPPAGRGETPATAINASTKAPSSRTNGQARDAPDETAGGSVVSLTGPGRYTGARSSSNEPARLIACHARDEEIEERLADLAEPGRTFLSLRPMWAG
jgi:hypothetical protein